MVTDRTITPYREGPYIWPSQEQREAYSVALHALSEEFPPLTAYQYVDRQEMLYYARRGEVSSARTFAILSGIPKDRIEAIEALLF